MNGDEFVVWVVSLVKEEFQTVDDEQREFFLEKLRTNSPVIKEEIAENVDYWVQMASAKSRQGVTISDIALVRKNIFDSLCKEFLK